jgi:hypothetical protein
MMGMARIHPMAQICSIGLPVCVEFEAGDAPFVVAFFRVAYPVKPDFFLPGLLSIFPGN